VDIEVGVFPELECLGVSLAFGSGGDDGTCPLMLGISSTTCDFAVVLVAHNPDQDPDNTTSTEVPSELGDHVVTYPFRRYGETLALGAIPAAP
jgi:hypothetical protein